MKKIIFVILMLTLCGLLFVGCATKNPSDSTSADSSADSTENDTNSNIEQSVSSIYNYNISSELDSHKDEWQNSHLELSYRDKILLDQSTTTQTQVWYPRIKQTANGEYILLFMNGSTGNHIYISRSKDLKRWYGTERLFEGSAATSSSPLYASADAIVLENGDILAVAGFRGYKTYKGDSKTNGIRLRRSTDNGVTWSEPETIYTGGVWEPSLLQLKSGEVQLYWTNTHVGGAPAQFGGRTDDNSTGTAMLRSFDNGHTWNNNIAVPYTAQIVAQQFTTKGSDGNYYSGQMPVAWQLNNGKIALALEIRIGKDNNKTYNMSMAYTDGNNPWPVSLGADEQGPTTLVKNMFLKMAGPYIRQFESGESLLSYHWGSKWYIKVGNAEANSFGDSYTAFGSEQTSMWGSMELIGSHTIIGTVPSVVNKDDKGNYIGTNGIYIGKFNLNHTISSTNKDITVDGYLSEWNDVTEAFFVGSESQAQSSVRVSEDAENVYFAAEVLDYYITSEDKIAFLVGDHSTGKYLNVAISPELQIEAACYIVGTSNNNKDRDTGYIVEIKMPKSLFSDNTLIFTPALYNKDQSEDTTIDYVGDISVTNTQNWLKIKLSD